MVPGRIATIATGLSLVAVAVSLNALHPAAAAAWLGSTAIMTWAHRRPGARP